MNSSKILSKIIWMIFIVYNYMFFFFFVSMSCIIVSKDLNSNQRSLIQLYLQRAQLQQVWFLSTLIHTLSYFFIFTVPLSLKCKLAWYLLTVPLAQNCIESIILVLSFKKRAFWIIPFMNLNIETHLIYEERI